MYDLMRELLQLFFYASQGWCLQYFYGSFFETRRQNSRWSRYLVIGLWVLARWGISRLWPRDDTTESTIGILVMGFVAVIVIARIFYGKSALTLYLAVTFTAASEISFLISYTVLELSHPLISLWRWGWEREGLISTEVFLEAVKGTWVVLMALIYFIFIVLFYLTLKAVVKLYREKDYVIRRTEFWFMLTPAAVGLLVCALLRTIMITVENGLPRMLYDEFPLLLLLVPVTLLLLLLSIPTGVKLFHDMIDLHREKNGRILLEKQIDTLREQMGETERLYAGMRRMRHDLKNQLAVAIGLAGRGRQSKQEDGWQTNREEQQTRSDIGLPSTGDSELRKQGDGENGLQGSYSDELRAYLAELSQALERLENKFNTGNRVADTVLNIKSHEAAGRVSGVEIDADGLFFPTEWQVEDYDIGVILGNALDNAIEACEKERKERQEADCFIRIYSFQKSGMFFLEVENSFSGELLKKGRKEFPLTGKADKEAHGIGLSSIKTAAEKYQGVIDWTAEEGVFHLTVMLKV